MITSDFKTDASVFINVKGRLPISIHLILILIHLSRELWICIFFKIILLFCYMCTYLSDKMRKWIDE